MFTINQGIDGAESIIFSLFTKNLSTSVINFFLFIGLAFFVSYLLRKKYKNITFSKILSLFSILSAIIVVIELVYFFPVVKYVQTWYSYLKEPQHSDFYQREYVSVGEIKFPNTKKNLILVFLESMESNFQDSTHGGNLPVNRIPEITELMERNDSFVPGGQSVFGTNWTVASLISKTCGIPLNYPPGVYHSAHQIKNFLPNAVCLSDILKQNDYNVLFAQGSKKEFASMDGFASTHHIDSFRDVTYYLTANRFSEEKKANWGINDRDLYNLVKRDIDSVSKEQAPFAFVISTMDSHTPYGYMDPKCTCPPNLTAKQLYPYVLECSSKLLKDFIEWTEKQSWFENTVIAVMGDHETYVPAQAVGFTEEKITHFWMNFFMNSTVQASVFNRKFTSFDMFPTILEAMGVDVPNHALGLGRSLYSQEPTLLEKYGADSLNILLKGRSYEYDYFLYERK
ncbi:MAG: LTA synthase family protein [Fibrobacter sp.]|nr:LTA synthase family protein [Fibrobacter sp.]